MAGRRQRKWQGRIDEKLLRFLRMNGDALGFARSFWKHCEINARDRRVHSKYAKSLLLDDEGKSLAQVTRRADVNPRYVRDWLTAVTKPKLARFLEAYLRYGQPRRGWVWLSIDNSAYHGAPLGPFVQVPLKIRNWRDVRDVLRHVRPLARGRKELSRVYMLGFLLGVLVGDAAKKRQQQWHRHIELILSKRYETNLLIGDFTSECAHGIGLRMERERDQAPYGGKPNGFFRWESQSSPLVDWIFNVCLGLKDDELTTYNPVRMDWALTAPGEFRRGLVQGMAESDGSVSIASQTVEFWIGPNWEFVRRLLLTFGVRSFQSRQALSVTKREISKLRRIPPFAPHLGTVRCRKFERLAKARHIEHGTRLPNEIRLAISKAAQRGLSNPAISEEILDRFGTIPSFEAVQRWAGRGREEHESCGSVEEGEPEGQDETQGQR